MAWAGKRYCVNALILSGILIISLSSNRILRASTIQNSGIEINDKSTDNNFSREADSNPQATTKSHSTSSSKDSDVPDKKSYERFPTDCQLSSNADAPIPLIYMSLGRSGSSVTWDTMARLMGDSDPITAYEITGSTSDKSEKFFNGIPAEAGSNWSVSWLCRAQKEAMESENNHKMVGFQWKPYLNTFDHEYGESAIEQIGLQDNPRIRIIYVTRNPINQKLSNMRHTKFESNHDNKMPAHCAVGDEDCIREHEKQEVEGVVFPTGHALKNWLHGFIQKKEVVFGLLEKYNVDYTYTEYEKLYTQDDAEEWMRLFKFVGRGPQSGLQKSDIEKHFSMAKTNNAKKHYDAISNYDEVLDTLKGTEYEHYLDKREEDTR